MVGHARFVYSQAACLGRFDPDNHVLVVGGFVTATTNRTPACAELYGAAALLALDGTPGRALRYPMLDGVLHPSQPYILVCPGASLGPAQGWALAPTNAAC